MRYEIELKIQLNGNEKTDLENHLNSGTDKVKFLGGYEQTDYYFDTITPSFAEKDTALRVRVENTIGQDKNDKTLELTYKGKKLNPTSKTRLEYNINLEPSTDFSTVENFFKELGFIKSIHIYKTRKNYLLENDIVLSLDANELGDFVEIEKISTDENQIDATEEYLWQKIQSLIGQISRDRQIVKSYLELILESRQRK